MYPFGAPISVYSIQTRTRTLSCDGIARFFFVKKCLVTVVTLVSPKLFLYVRITWEKQGKAVTLSTTSHPLHTNSGIKWTESIVRLWPC